MNTTFNPQTAAKQDNKKYRDVTTPEAVRVMAEKVVDQSREQDSWP